MLEEDYSGRGYKKWGIGNPRDRALVMILVGEDPMSNL